ncbi:MAG: response regulator transcription factor, partial [Paracoccaceae bacterium]
SESGREFRRVEKSNDALRIELIEPRTFERECFEVSVRSLSPDIIVDTFASIGEWKDSVRRDEAARVVLLNIGGRRIADAGVRADLTSLIRLSGPTPVIVLAVSEDLDDMLDAVEFGARGYIPASVGVAVMVGATKLAANGGVFLPAPSIFAMREQLKNAADDHNTGGALFTKRQAAVADALRRGKANKMIAYELNMCESTVKVHIRTIMKRLKASNRTEAAFKLHGLENNNQ